MKHYSVSHFSSLCYCCLRRALLYLAGSCDNIRIVLMLSRSSTFTKRARGRIPNRVDDLIAMYDLRLIDFIIVKLYLRSHNTMTAISQYKQVNLQGLCVYDILIPIFLKENIYFFLKFSLAINFLIR